MSQQALPAPNTARLAITSFCTLLRHHGITLLEPEIVRQAKFDGPVTGALWRVLHDVVLIVLAGCPAGPACQAALSRQWSQAYLELSGNDDDEFPREGAVLILHQLATWGAPAGLLRRLGPISDPDPISNPDLDRDLNLSRAACSSVVSSWPRSCRPRPLLLALSWLVAVAGLFERRIRDLEPGPELRALLPPYPQDACVSPAVQMAYDAAAMEALEHVQKLPVSTASAAAAAAAASPAGRSGGSGGGGMESLASTEALWGDVETAAQRAVMLCGRVRSRLVALQAATDCRIRLSHSLWSQQAATAPASRPLTPYELQLCGQPSKMQAHLEALETATLALLEQQELAAHGALFYEWAGSALEEEHQEQRQRQRQPHRGGAGDAATAGKERSRTGGGEALASLEHLPYIDSDAGVRLAAHLEAQLQAAVQAAEPEISAAQRRRDAAFSGVRQDGSSSVGGGAVTAPPGGSGGRASQQHQSLSSVTVEHFLTLAERAVPQNLLPGIAAARHGAGGSGGNESVNGGGGGGGSGDGLPGLPLLVGSGGGDNDTDAGPWRLPDDLTAALAAVQLAEHQQRCTAEEEEVQFQQLRYAALMRYDFGGDGGTTPPAALYGPAAIGPVGVPAVAAASETQRLLGAVFAAARPLARIRAAHKASLMAALHDMPDGYFVSGV
ncbi:hypothetical protein VaNZ11_007590 [Volvox africanus]|uniref:Tubulin epsilon and delta complex protein 1 domain-containing protein n=1 Tax=Volvox africanus TaxID=51714 RepID=A0ABQ5S3B7_9CHLO|nr:hypothetical protein VaNZ11_007590 [Volvox africanus]